MQSISFAYYASGRLDSAVSHGLQEAMYEHDVWRVMCFSAIYGNMTIKAGLMRISQNYSDVFKRMTMRWSKYNEDKDQNNRLVIHACLWSEI